MTSTFLATLLLSFTVFAAIQANEVPCSTVMPDDVVNDDVIADSGPCVLDGVTVNGDVKVENGASLTTNGDTTIDGDVKGDGAGAISLLQGTSVKTVDVKESGAITVKGSTITAGLKVDKSVGGLIICGSTINDDIEYKESDGAFLLVESSSCPTNTISKSIKIDKGTGSVQIIRNDVGEEVSIKERDGEVTIEGAELNKLTVEKVEKKVLVDGATVEEAQIKENTGGVVIKNSVLGTLDCQDNSPLPTGSGNTVDDGIDQCLNF